MKILIQFILFLNIALGTWQNINSTSPASTSLSVLSSNVVSTTLDFSIDGFHLVPVETNQGEMFLAKLNDGASLLEAAAPDLQKFGRSIIIPDQSQMHVNIISSEYVEYENILIAPSKGNLNRLINPNDVPYEFGEVYNNDEFYPNQLVGLEDPYIIRDLRGQTVVFYPFSYNPVQQKLRVYSNITIEVYSHGTSNINTIEERDQESKYPLEYVNIFENHFLNFNNDTRFDYITDSGTMLVICYDSFIDIMLPLVEWKNRKGIPTEIVAISEVGSNANLMQTFINAYYTENDLTYLLLVGDIAQIPSHTVGGSLSDPTFGFIEGNDEFAEVIVGRFSAQNPNELQTQVDRTLQYEQTPSSNSNWFSNALGIASNQGPGYGGMTDDQFNDFLWETTLSQFTYTNFEGLYDGSGGSVSAAINAINAGVGIINYTGHAYQTGWGNGAPLSISDVHNLTNTGMLPFIFTVGCNPGEFDYGSECFTESWLRATDNNGNPTGAIGHIGSTISQSWEPPMHGQWAMNSILSETYSEQVSRSYGGIAINGCMHMNEAQGSSGTNETTYWTIFGDPSLIVRSTIPFDLEVSYNNTMTVGQTELPVNVSVDGALISISQNNELISYTYSNNGTANLIFEENDIAPGDYDVTVTAFNAIPHESVLSVILPDGPYVTLDSFYIDDSNGNNNGMADFDETVGLHLQAYNLGVDIANNTYAEVSIINDDYISLINNTTFFGNIDPSSSSNANGVIEFSITHNVPDGHNALFNILFYTDNASWEQNFNIEINAPHLTISNPTFIDASGDGIWDAGESITISLLFENQGSADHFTYPGVHLSVDNDDANIIDGIDFYWLYGLPAGTSEIVTFSVVASETANMATEVQFSAIASELNCETQCTESSVLSFSFIIGLPFVETLDVPLNLVAVSTDVAIDLSWEEPNSCDDGYVSDCSDDDCCYEAWIGDGFADCEDQAWGCDLSCYDNDGGDCDGRNNKNINIDRLTRLIPEINDNLNNREFIGYYLYKDDSFIAFTDQTYYSDSNLIGGEEYCYHVTAIYDGAQSNPSNTSCSEAQGSGITGDITGDGVVNVLDVISIVNIILDPDISYSLVSDLNLDGANNIMDVVALINIILS